MRSHRSRKRGMKFRKSVVVYLLKSNPEETVDDESKVINLYEFSVMNDFRIFDTIVDNYDNELAGLTRIRRLIKRGEINGIVCSQKDSEKINTVLESLSSEDNEIIKRLLIPVNIVKFSQGSKKGK
ncbi:MAG: hypothetical protein ACTSSP_05730 [Candidatus Asgardarchaeia archaeon]